MNVNKVWRPTRLKSLLLLLLLFPLNLCTAGPYLDLLCATGFALILCKSLRNRLLCDQVWRPTRLKLLVNQSRCSLLLFSLNLCTAGPYLDLLCAKDFALIACKSLYKPLQCLHSFLERNRLLCDQVWRPTRLKLVSQSRLLKILLFSVKTKQEQKKQSFKGNNRGFCFGHVTSKQVSYVARADRRELSTPATSSGGRPDIGVRLDHLAGD